MYIVHLLVKYKQYVRSKQKQTNVKLLHCFIIFCVDITLCEPSLLQCLCILLGNCHNIKSDTGNEYTQIEYVINCSNITVLTIVVQNSCLLY